MYTMQTNYPIHSIITQITQLNPPIQWLCNFVEKLRNKKKEEKKKRPPQSSPLSNISVETGPPKARLGYQALIYTPFPLPAPNHLPRPKNHTPLSKYNPP